MARHKWRSIESAILVAPFVFLSLYLLGVPLFLPAPLLPERRYVALSPSAGAEGLRLARGGAFEAFALLPDRLLALPSSSAPESEWRRLAALLPARPLLAPLAEALGTGLPLLRRASLVTDFVPDSEELADLAKAARASGLPLEIRAPASAGAGLLLSYSFRATASGDSLPFELLLSEEGRRDELEVRAAYRGAQAGGESGRLLWKGGGADLPLDRVLRLSAPRQGLAGISLIAKGPGGAKEIRLLTPGGSRDEPSVLVIAPPGRPASILESLYPARRVEPGLAAGLDLARFPLVVIDGIPLRSLEGRLGRALESLARDRLSSLLFAADSPDFGGPGDNPGLEGLLPVSLLPRSLKDLPDMAVLILLDYSGSMFGGKLSLAKVASLELVKGLKAGDRVGLLLFSDRRNWVWNFEARSAIAAAPALEPVEAEGGTELGPALEEGLARLAAVPMAERHLVVISDGVTKPADFQALAAKARAAGVTISTMGVGEDMDRPLLERLAAQAKGRFYLVGSASEIPSLIFEDRKSVARAAFATGSIPVLDAAGTRVATIGGMGQYAAKPGATTYFTNAYGDPLLSAFEAGNRAVLLFASDLHGAYTADFFGKPSVIAALRDRLDLLFPDKPPEISVFETARETRVYLRSPALASPLLRVSRDGAEAGETAFHSLGEGLWEARARSAETGLGHALLVDRGSALASFDLPFDEGLSGVDSGAAAALAAYKPLLFRSGGADALWLLLFFASALGATLVLRLRR